MDMNDKRLRMSIPAYLKDLANRHESDDADEVFVNSIIKKLKIDNIKVVSGVVYTMPYNTPPISIHKFAETLLLAISVVYGDK